MRKDLVLVGVVTGAHGIRGEVKLQSFTDDPSSIARYGPLVTGTGAPIEILRLRPQKQGFIAALKCISDRNAAEALKGAELFVPRDRLPPAAPNEIYIHDLVGLTAMRPDGGILGRIVAVGNFGAGNLLDVRLNGRDETILIPFAKQFVGAIDLAAGKAVIDLPDGYLEKE